MSLDALVYVVALALFMIAVLGMGQRKLHRRVRQLEYEIWMRNQGWKQ